MGVTITRHTAQRYLEMVEEHLPHAVVLDRLSSPAIEAAARFGASYVRLAGGQRIVLVGQYAVTVLPADQCIGALDRRRRPAK